MTFSLINSFNYLSNCTVSIIKDKIYLLWIIEKEELRLLL